MTILADENTRDDYVRKTASSDIEIPNGRAKKDHPGNNGASPGGEIHFDRPVH